MLHINEEFLSHMRNHISFHFDHIACHSLQEFFESLDVLKNMAFDVANLNVLFRIASFCCLPICHINPHTHTMGC